MQERFTHPGNHDPMLAAEVSVARDFFGALYDPNRSSELQASASTIDIVTNTSRLVSDAEALAPYSHYLAAAYDPFTLHETGEQLAGTLLKNVKSLDKVELAVMIHATGSVLMHAAAANRRSGSSTSMRTIHDLELAALQTAIHRAPLHILMASGASLDTLCSTIFSAIEDYSPGSIRLSTAEIADKVADDRAALCNLLYVSEFVTPDPVNTTYNSYNAPLTARNMAALNTAAADTIESLHLLKAYRVVPFEVPAETVDLPWDIAVMPPVGPADEPEDIGAIADFILLDPEWPRIDISVSGAQTLTAGINSYVVGGAPSYMRFRLHDNGHISYGLLAHNIPSDYAEQEYKLHGAEAAFSRLRGLFIALAFDAMVPEEVMTGRHVKNSVAQTYHEASPEPAQRITQLLLRRRKALRYAEVSGHQRTPRDWPAPRVEVGGYMRKLPAGCRARNDAEVQARKYYQERGLRFDGIPAGYNFVSGYTRNGDALHVPYRRATFRTSSATHAALGNLATPPPSGGKRRKG